MEKPQVIFLDAVGTLFGVRGSVGEIYGEIAREFGVEAESAALERAFYQVFQASSPLTFPGVSVTEVPRREFEWWYEVSRLTFEKANALEQFSDFQAFFTRLYGHFATPKPWQVYPDILPALEKWKEQRIELGIISNFDSRIHAVLEGLELRKYFHSITISSSLGVAKPDPAIFHKALAKHQCEPSRAWHVGDSVKEDYEGAKAAGLHGILLERQPVLV
ncbi:HAD family hydrolase [Oscillatoria sp. FACHB-1406]|uniref:HAD-IA family hydrolase n=1 Tax=Oscillatoria sp. FACHB-1406 TaxID=2692846 RepID=UPI001687D76D|nr:HAD family hydrolase [Oscillatoria sp. FACHB-1406]MBD2577420.1 HAD family hydrolase [Oscillatoria sp. FACHB-1406]